MEARKAMTREDTPHIGQEYSTSTGQTVEYRGRTPDGRLEVIHMTEIDGPDGVEVAPGATIFVDEIFQTKGGVRPC